MWLARLIALTVPAVILATAAGLPVAAALYSALSRMAAIAIDLDTGSVAAGVILGITLSTFARLQWSRLPQQMTAWLTDNAGAFSLTGWAAVALVVLVVY